MKFKYGIFVLSLMLCILLSGCVAASDVNDTLVAEDIGDEPISVNDEQAISYENDANPAVGAASDLIGDSDNGTFTALQLKIQLAPEGSTVNLNRDYKYNDEFKITNGIFIDKDLTINGNGHTIDGLGKSRIFNINYGDGLKFYKVTFNNITFKNGNAKIYGGAILNFADLTVDNCKFINNTAGTAGGAINSLGSLTLKNSAFNKNSAGGDAGAVFSLTIIKGYEFYKNYFLGRNATEDTNLLFTIAMQVLEPGKDTISNCVFTNNVANGRGGGAVYAFSHIDIDSCTFNSNKAGDKGGAVFGNKDLYIKNSKFNNNKVSMYGGAVYFKFHEISGHYDENGSWVDDVKFYTNLIQNCVFKNNVAKERGGAIYGFKFSKTPKVTAAHAVKCTFTDNLAEWGNEVYGGSLRNCVLKNTLTLKTVKIKKSAKKLVLTAKLKKGSKVLKNKKVTFKFNGKKYTAKTNKKGVAKVTIKSSVLKKLRIGKKVTYRASYSKYYVNKSAKVSK